MLNIFRRKPKTDAEVVRMAGHTFRVLNPVQMSNVRKVRLFYEDYAREWGMTKGDILEFDKQLLKETEFPEASTVDALNAKLMDKLKRIYTLVSLRSAMITEDYQYKPLLKAAATIILIDDEDENKPEDKWMTLKMKLCRDNSEVEGFFLHVGMTFQLSMRSSANTSEAWDWLDNQSAKNMEKNLLKTIGTSIYSIGDSENTET